MAPSRDPGSVLVTGAAGMLAHDLIPTLRAAGWQVTPSTRADLDITDEAACRSAVPGHDVVINTAAWTAVDAAETHEPEAYAANALGPAALARATAGAGAELLHLSTDYAFSGELPTGASTGRPFAENDPVDPRLAYGRTKAAGEQAVRAANPRSWILRTAWLYGAGGPNFVATMLHLAAERETLAVVDDQIGAPTWTRDVADLIVRTLAHPAAYGIYHATAGGQVSWHGFAREIFRLAGLDPQRVRPITSAEFPQAATRPAWSVLGHDAWDRQGITPIGPWQDGLATYLRGFPASG